MNKRLFTFIIFFTLLGLQKQIFCGNRVSKTSNQNYSTNKNFKNLSFKNYQNLRETSTSYPNNLIYFFNYLIANLDETGVENKSNNFFVDIESDIQKDIDSVFIAEGNVIIRTTNAVMKTDKLEYDQNLKKLNIEGNIKFKTNTQFFTANKIEYDFQNKKGFISDVYGSIDFDGLADLNLNSNNKINLNDEFSEISKIKAVSLNNSSRFTLGNIFKRKISNDSLIRNVSELSSDIKFKEINNTRFYSEKININGNIWQSDIMLLTNDPFNYPQLIILNKDFKLSFDEGVSEIYTKWSSVILDQKLTVPLGPRRINLEKKGRWGFGYDKKNYDGVFAYRNLDTISFSKNNNSKLDLKTLFFLQRSIIGKTNSFPENNKSTISPNVEQEANWPDYFGFFGSFSSLSDSWKYILDFESNSLDIERLNNAFATQTYLTKNLSKFINDKEKKSGTKDLTFFGSYREKTRNGSLGESIINSSYGVRYDSKKNYENQSSHNSITYGNYIAKSKKNDSLISKNRLNVFLKRNFNYPIWEPKVNTFIDSSYLYNPSVVKKGLFFDLETTFEFLRYNDNFKQDMFLVKAGPRLVYGDFKKKFLDYTEMTIYPRFKFNRGESPFIFDQIVDNRVIEIAAKQQIFGPLTLKISSEINIEEDFKEDRFLNSTVNLGFNRRAYKFELFYNLEREIGGFTFNIHSFKFNGLGEKYR